MDSPVVTETKTWMDRLVPFFLFGVLVLALFVRVYHIDSLPAGLYPDESVNGTDAELSNQTGEYQLFYTNNYGREGLFINLQALAIKHLGNTVPVLRLWSTLFGTLAVLGLYFLARELYGRRLYGLIAAFFLATSYWAINFSRIGFRAIMVTFLLSFSFFFFFRGLRSQRWYDFFLAGIFLGTGLHTYVAFRVVPLILILLLPILVLSYEGFLARFWKFILIYLLGALIAAAPMFYDFYLHPDHLSSRTGAVSIFSPEVNGGDLLGTFGKTFGLSLIKYNFWGDQNWRHNYPPYPILDPITGAFFLSGFLYLIWHTVKLFGLRFREKIRDYRLIRSWFLLSSFFVMLMPEFLTKEGLPHALRSIGTQAPVYLIALLPITWIVNRSRQSLPGTRTALLSLLVFGFILSATINLTKYFIFFNAQPEQKGAFNLNFRNMANYAMSLPSGMMKYIVPNGDGKLMEDGLPVSAHPIKFLTDRKVENLVFLTPETTVQSANSVIIFMKNDDAMIERIKQHVPRSSVEHIDPFPGTKSDFTVVVLP